jgi:transcriptional regulator with XRE-family HTH domain
MRNRLVRKFKDPEYRHSYIDAFLNTSIAAQIRALREKRGWSQKELAEKIGTKQSGVSALENVNYSRWSINTLRRLARAFDVALTVKFESFGEAIDEITQFSKETTLLIPSFDEDSRVSQPIETAGSSLQSAMKPPDVYGRWARDLPPVPPTDIAIRPSDYPFAPPLDTTRHYGGEQVKPRLARVAQNFSGPTAPSLPLVGLRPYKPTPSERHTQ